MGLSVGRVGYEILGGQFFFVFGFFQKVVRFVELYVVVKWYLCVVDKDYMNKFFDVSKRSFVYQGGFMSGVEKEEFGFDMWCKEMCQLRKWDDEVKVEGFVVRDVESWRLVLE